jgi:hypothetical protein
MARAGGELISAPTLSTLAAADTVNDIRANVPKGYAFGKNGQ